MPVHDRLQRKGLLRARQHTETAALTGKGGDGIGRDCVESASVAAHSALVAPLLVAGDDLGAPELLLRPYLGGEKEVQVGRVNVAVGKHRVGGQRCEGTQEGRFARPPLSAYDGDLLHIARHASSPGLWHVNAPAAGRVDR